MFLRRIGPNPHGGGARSTSSCGCPDIFELQDGDFAVIGLDITRESLKQLPGDASCGSDERIVKLPRRTLVLARADIPERV